MSLGVILVVLTLAGSNKDSYEISKLVAIRIRCASVMVNTSVTSRDLDAAVHVLALPNPGPCGHLEQLHWIMFPFTSYSGLPS